MRGGNSLTEKLAEHLLAKRSRIARHILLRLQGLKYSVCGGAALTWFLSERAVNAEYSKLVRIVNRAKHSAKNFVHLRSCRRPLHQSIFALMRGRVLLERPQILSIGHCICKGRLRRYVSTSATTNKSESLGPTTQDGHRTLRVRKGNNPPLPIPPVLDPIAISERDRWTKKKPQPKHDELTPFQQKLYQNPYGMPFIILHSITN